jgi:hypothetical protein
MEVSYLSSTRRIIEQDQRHRITRTRISSVCGGDLSNVWRAPFVADLTPFGNLVEGLETRFWASRGVCAEIHQIGVVG